MTALNQGNCGPYDFPQVQEMGGSDVQVGQDAFNPVGGMSETTTVPLPFNGTWNTVMNVPASNTSVVAYPGVWTPYSEETISSFHDIYSSFAANSDESSNTSTDIGFDMWFNDWNDEVMIQTKEINRQVCTGSEILATVQFGGTNGVPVNTWNLCIFDTERIWQITGTGNVYGFTSGSVDILAMLNYLMSHGHLPPSTTMTAIAYGFEVVTTTGKDETFSMTNFSITQD